MKIIIMQYITVTNIFGGEKRSDISKEIILLLLLSYKI